MRIGTDIQLFIITSWNEWLTLPIKYCDLPSSAQCAITVWDIVGPRKPVSVGGTTLELFGKHL